CCATCGLCCAPRALTYVLVPLSPRVRSSEPLSRYSRARHQSIGPVPKHYLQNKQEEPCQRKLRARGGEIETISSPPEMGRTEHHRHCVQTDPSYIDPGNEKQSAGNFGREHIVRNERGIPIRREV